MAEYRDQYETIRGAGADLAAVSVDGPARSERVRRELRLPFPILCDVKRELITAWGIMAKMKGGIALPAVFVVDQDRRVRFRSIDTKSRRVPTAAIVDFLRSGMPAAAEAGRNKRFPRLEDWTRAIRSTLRYGVRSRS